jgi:hypothetical protein
MKLARLPHEPAALVDFFQQGLERLGAVCERTWYDRLQLVAESAAARLWNSDGALCETDLHFVAAEDAAPRDAANEVFPGCPLTFRLAETLRPSPLPLERAVLEATGPSGPASNDVAEKLWHAQWPGATRWRIATAFTPAHHFSLVTLVRCEIQAIDQHWSLHRLALSLADGELDEALAADLQFQQLAPDSSEPIAWPAHDPALWQEMLRGALELELASDLATIRSRQEHYLRRELDRIDDYFDHYERELTQRAARTASDSARIKTNDRLAAAKAEHARRRQDQVQRHEIRVVPHFDALLLLAEPAWQATVSFIEGNQARSVAALFVPRARRWVVASVVEPRLGS